jgi:hypothetical protein
VILVALDLARATSSEAFWIASPSASAGSDASFAASAAKASCSTSSAAR